VAGLSLRFRRDVRFVFVVMVFPFLCVGGTPRRVTARTRAILGMVIGWPAKDDGLDQKKLEAVIDTMVRVGNIRPGKAPVAYDRLVDRSIWRDAAAMAK
jgi:hypothetical protein